MNFNINKWIKYRKQAETLGLHITSYKDDKGTIHMDKETLLGYIAHITSILKMCSNYMDKCNLTMPAPLWKYKVKDPTTQPSSVAFLYKEFMTPEAIQAYGEGFMSEPLPEPKKAA
jgi:hypothetical protein